MTDPIGELLEAAKKVLFTPASELLRSRWQELELSIAAVEQMRRDVNRPQVVRVTAGREMMKNEEINALLQAASGMDWLQVVLNGGPPCFHLEPKLGKFCLRAKSWHDKSATKMFHAYIPLDMLISSIARPK